MSDAARQRRRRDRARGGLGILHPEVDLAGIADMLHAEGYLGDWRSEDRDELSRALSHYLDAVLRVTGHSDDGC